MDKGYLLDTNIVMAYFNNEASARRHFRGVVSFFISAITAGELFHGITNSKSANRNLTALREFLEFQPILQVDLGTADRYGRVATQLKSGGLPIRDNDIWIAAHALQHNLTVVTRDSDFDRLVELGVAVEKW